MSDKSISQPLLQPPSQEATALNERLFLTELERNGYQRELENKDALIKKYEVEMVQLREQLNDGTQKRQIKELIEKIQLKEAENAIYKQDFESERNDRQRIHAEYEELKAQTEESRLQHRADKETVSNLREIMRDLEEEIKVLTAQVNAYSHEVDKQKRLVTQSQVKHKTEVNELKMQIYNEVNEKEDLLIAYHQEKAKVTKLEEQMERMKVKTRPGRSYSYSSSHHYDSFPSDSDSISPPPSVTYYPPVSPTPSPSPYINERLSKPGIIREDVISRHHDHTTSIPSHIRPQFSKEEMYRRFGGGQMRREEYERPRLSPAYTSSIPDFIQPQFSEEEMRRRFKPRVSPAYTSSIPDSVQPQVSEEEMRRRFKNRQQPYNQYSRENSEEYLQANEEADRALLEVDRVRKENPINPSYNHKPGNKNGDRNDRPYDPK